MLSIQRKNYWSIQRKKFWDKFHSGRVGFGDGFAELNRIIEDELAEELNVMFDELTGSEEG